MIGLGSWRYSPALVPGLISFHYPGGQTVEHYILVAAELFETVERRFVCLRRSDFANLLEFGNDVFHEVEKGVFVSITVELVDYIVDSIGQPLAFKFAVYFCQPLNVKTDAVTDCVDNRLTFTLVSCRDHRARLAPLRR